MEGNDAANPDASRTGSYTIHPHAAAAGDNYTITYVDGTLTISEKPPATVTKAPEAKTLTYTGSEQALVTAGTATGGEMQYALGTATEATDPYTTSIPTATNAGTYYVWYMVIGDSNHSDTKPVSIQAVIEKPEVTPTPKVTPTPEVTPTPAPTVEKVKLTAVYNSRKGADIRWKKAAGATGYEVYCFRKADGLRKVATIKDPNVTQCYDKKIRTGCWGRVYHYYVRGLYGKKKGPKSDKIALVRLAPMKITGLEYTSKGKVTCTYECTIKDNKAAGYEIQYAASKDDLTKRKGTYKAVRVKGRKNLSKVVKGLKKGKTYYFRVRAYANYTNSNSKKKTRTWSKYSDIAKIKLK